MLDIEKALQGLGLASDMTSIATTTTQAQFAGTVPSVPFQMNIEGLFYNKKIFAKYGIGVPTTFTQLLADAAKLKAAGVTPISASGSSGWTIIPNAGLASTSRSSGNRCSSQILVIVVNGVYPVPDHGRLSRHLR